MMSKWFKFALNKNRIIFINMAMIDIIEFTLTTVIIGDFELDGEEAERFRRDFTAFNSQEEARERNGEIEGKWRRA